MATVVLQTVGAAIGGAIGGPFGAVLGRAAGAFAGQAIDQSFLAKDQVVQGPRLENSRILSSTDGAPIPRIYGRNRVSGQIIWATRFEEVTNTQKAGGKGTGPSSSTTTFSYFANFAVGLCEGPISGVRRIWADGEELDLTKIEYRFYSGTEDQEVDPLIEAKQGLGNAPAFRGTAYIVFESLPLENYGNRIPQLSFELIRAIGKVEHEIESITIIPGSTEFGYDTQLAASGGGEETYNAHNRHASIALTDWTASIDELQMVCPNLKSVSLVIAWFGNDLRAGECKIAPGVTTRTGSNWQVNGLRRNQAFLVSQIEGRASFGGTPDDASIIRAIADLRSRGLKVIIYPFIMMDIPQNNQIPGLSGEQRQPAFPWRGEISCNPKPSVENTVDKTNNARLQIEAFNDEYKNLISHYAELSNAAGGVDGFLIGSELRGLTRVRDETGKFPFVETLVDLAQECKQLLGSNTIITYAADWSEYFGYQPQDGSGDVLFNLDDLWASPNIDAIGIDNYMPLSDWRDEGEPQNPLAKSPHSIEYFKSNVGREEGYDWFYATSEDRLNGIRTPITDGQGEPWIYRYKDIVSWWSNQHHNRLNGVRQVASTNWVPQSKPIFFTEVGCPAVDKGTNQPNVFFDSKSDQSALPYFSSGGRDDLVQRRYLEATYEFWKDSNNNPRSEVYNGRMVDTKLITPWAWDARPFPWFPLSLETWSDGENWHLGHWLNGRLGGCSLQDLVLQIIEDYDHDDIEVELDGIVDGYIIPTQASARAALEPLLGLYNIRVVEEAGKIIFRSQNYADRIDVDRDAFVHVENQIIKTSKRGSELELPAEAVVTHLSIFNEYEDMITKSRRLEGASDRQISLQAPVVLPEPSALKLADTRLREDWIGREEKNITLSINKQFVATGDVLKLEGDEGREWQIDSIERSLTQTLSLKSIINFPALSSSETAVSYPQINAQIFGRPEFIMLDLPLLKAADQSRLLSHIALSARPWAGNYNIYSSPDTEGFLNRTSLQAQANIGNLLNDLSHGPIGRWDYNNFLIVALPFGNFESVLPLTLFNGGNILALESINGNYELLQFSHADLQEDGSWKLSKLIRAQLGTETEMVSGARTGAKVVLLNDAIYPLELQQHEVGIQQNWRAGPSRDVISADTYSMIQHTSNARSQKMLSPAHLRVKRLDGNNLQFSWIRRGRIDADNWDNVDIPLDADQEKYLVQIKSPNGNIKHEAITQLPSYNYTQEMRQSDFGSLNADLEIHVAQLGSNATPGRFNKLTVSNL